MINRLDEDEVLRVVAAAGRLTEDGVQLLAWEQPVGTGVNGRVARTGERSLVDDTRLDPDYVGSGPSLDPGSELSLPIHVGGRVWGVLNLEQMATHSFDEYDVMLAEAVVAQTGAALHRCRLVDEMERSFSTTLGVLCDALESKDAYTADHAAAGRRRSPARRPSSWGCQPHSSAASATARCCTTSARSACAASC